MSDSTERNILDSAIIEIPIIESLSPTEAEEQTIEIDNQISSNSLGEPVNILTVDTTNPVLSIDSFSGLPGEPVTVPITISDSEAVESLTINLSYDTSILNLFDPDPTTATNEGVRSANNSNFVLETNNPVANVNEETGEVQIALVVDPASPNLNENSSNGAILEIDFEIDGDADLGSLADIDLETVRVGINGNELVFDNENLVDGDIVVGNPTLEAALDTNINRFQNSDIPGTFIFAGGDESASIRANFSQFVEEGLAFRVADEAAEGFVPIFRFQSVNTPGTFLFVEEAERQSVNANFSADFTEEGLAFFVLPASSVIGETFFRFQNSDRPGTFLFAGEQESISIRANFPQFIEEGAAFNVG